MKNTIIPVSLFILYIISAVIISGSFIVLSGALAFVLWGLPIALSLVLAKRMTGSFKTAVIIASVYILISVIFLKRDDLYGREILERRQEGDRFIVVYELNPGAAGHLSFEEREYRIIIDTELFSVKLLERSERFSSSDGIR